MKIRTLLLGTATAFATVGGAQAADLAVAEPVDYVKVCDAYGTGYWYIPGTDACLKIGGYVKSTINIYSRSANRDWGADSSKTGYTLNTTTNVISAPGDHPARWDWGAEVSLQATIQSMSDIGLVTGFIDYRATSDNASFRSSSGPGGANLAYVDSAYLKAGPAKLGFFTSIYAYGATFLEVGPHAAFDAADFIQDQLAFNTSMGGVGVWLGIGDNRDGRGGSRLYKGNWPDILAALTGTSGGLDWKWSFAGTDTVFGTGWATQLGATWTAANGDAIRVKAAVGNGEGMEYVNNGSPVNGGTWWSAFLTGVHYWSTNVATELGGEYSAGPGTNMWEIGTETNWIVAKGLKTGIAAKVGDTNTGPTTWTVSFVGKRWW